MCPLRSNLRDEIVAATTQALLQINQPRFLRTERGYHGKFYCALQEALEERGLLQDGRILEMEYQKSARHQTSQRPDIVLHVPAEGSGQAVTENNFAVWALKRRATQDKANQDFVKLDQMFESLRYPLGIFVNIDTNEHVKLLYSGRFPERLKVVAVWLAGEQVVTRWSCP